MGGGTIRWACASSWCFRRLTTTAYLGGMYWIGHGVPQDRVAAHMWLSLAAAQVSTANRDTYVEARDAAAEEMPPEQIAEAQRLAREWKPTVEP